MAPPVNHGALSREADLRTMAYVLRFIDNNRGTYLNWTAQEPVLQQLSSSYQLKPHVKGYVNAQYNASALHTKIISWLNTRKVAQWKTKECRGEASVDKLFEIGSTMLEQKVRDDLAALIHNLPATPPPKSKSNSPEQEISGTYHDKTCGLSKARSTRNSTKPKLSNSCSERAAKPEDGDIEGDEADALAEDAESTGHKSRPGFQAKSMSRSSRRSTKQNLHPVASGGDDDGPDDGVTVALPPQPKSKAIRAAPARLPRFPNLGKSSSMLVVVEKDNSDDQKMNAEDQTESEGDPEAVVEDEDVTGVDNDDDDGVVMENEDANASKKRIAGADFEGPTRGGKKAKVSRATQSVARNVVKREATNSQGEFFDDQDEDIEDEGDRQLQSDDHIKTEGDDEDDFDIQADNFPESDVGANEVELQQSSPLPAISGASSTSRSAERRSGNVTSDGLQSFSAGDSDMVSTLDRQHNHSTALAAAASTTTTGNDRAHPNSAEDITKLDVATAMLKVNDCLTQVLFSTFASDGDAQVASIAMNPTRSLKGLYINTLGQDWLKVVQNVINGDDAARHFNAPALIKSLIWHYLRSEVLDKQVLRDTVSTLLGKLRAHVEPVLAEENVVYRSVLRRASEAQLKDSDFIEEDILNCAHDLKNKLMVTLRPHFDEMATKHMSQNWRKNLSKGLLDVCHQAILLSVKLEMEESKHEAFSFTLKNTFNEEHMVTEEIGAREGVVLLTQMPGLKKVMAVGEGEVVVKAKVVMWSDELYD